MPVCVHSRAKGLPAKDRKSTRLNSSHGYISYAVFCLKKKNYRLPSSDSLTNLSIVRLPGILRPDTDLTDAIPVNSLPRVLCVHMSNVLRKPTLLHCHT